jgi:putative phosphoserine phosphatase/1-acylglycerol-3-phosphate O-acyltransferase
VDGTLWAGFSAVAFFRERLVSGRMSPRELAEGLLGTLSFAVGRIGFSGFVAATTAAYRGLAESVLEEIGEEIFEKQMAAQIYPESRALVKAHQEQGHTLGIVSSATRYQVEPLARELGVDIVACTELEVEDGVFTGRVLQPTCFGKGKAVAVERIAAERELDLDETYFYTDSRDDLPALESVGRPRPLNPDSRLAQIGKDNGWPVRRFGSRGRPGAEAILRTGLVYGSLVPAAAAGLSVGLLTRSQREGVNLTGSLWGDVAIALSGVDVRVQGEEHLWSQRPAVFIFNHQSAIDMPLMLKLVRKDVTGIGKQELRWNPIFGPLFRAAGVVFVDRADSKKAIEALKPAVDALRHGRSLIIAPEGTRTPTPRLARFKKGAFHLAMQAGVPIVPVVFHNALDALPKHALVVRPATVEVEVLPPVDTSGWTKESLDAEIEAIRKQYLDVLEG